MKIIILWRLVYIKKNKVEFYIQNKTDDYRIVDLQLYIKMSTNDKDVLVCETEDIKLISKQALKVEVDAIKNFVELIPNIYTEPESREYYRIVIEDDRGKVFEVKY